ncbi:hypothetical protein IJT17_03920 [bacterium]|nr:hypothetical protein [bacterium]
MFKNKLPMMCAAIAMAGGLFFGSGIAQAQGASEEIPEKIYDMRGDDGILENFRPTGLSFLSHDRVLVCDGTDQRLHIFDTQGRRFKRLNVPIILPNPDYSALAPLSKDHFLVIGSHYHPNNYARFLNNRSLMHLYTLRGEIVTGESATKDYDPIVALRKTGYWGDYADKHMRVDGLAIAPEANKVYIALSQPFEEDGSVLIYEGNLEEILACDKRTKLSQHSYGIFPRVDEITEQHYRVTDICHIADRGLLILMSSAKPNGYTFGSNQLWFKPDDSEDAYLLAEDIAPGNYGAGIAVFSKESGSYDIAITFDNNPGKTSTPSRLMLLEDVSI